MAKDDTFTDDDLKTYQDENEGNHDGGKAIARADHQARNDYQDDGSPFGELADRERDTKEDVPSTKGEDDSSSEK